MSKENGKLDIRVYYCRNSVSMDEQSPDLLSLQQTAGVVLEAVPCSGRIDSRYLLKAFEGGANAVCVLTCPSGDCKLMEGNLRALRRVQSVRNLLSEAGIDPDSMQIFLPDTTENNALSMMSKTIANLEGAERQSAHKVTV